MKQPAALNLNEVTIRLRGTGAALVENLELSISPGTVTTLMGPSGSGKSTLLAFCAGFLDRSAFAASGAVCIGEDRIDGLPAERRRLGLLFQDALLFPHLSVGSNLLFGLPRSAARSRFERRQIIEDALAQAGLAGYADRDPDTLSGGQRARVALLRTLLAEPRALLLDEPFSKLDAALRAEIRTFLFEHVRARSLPTLLVTHDAADAEAAGGALVTS
ncbi:ATP-binding cassette domain-containing protein [Microvirga sp. BT688]|uniref:ATP-binding cassette domain-containing protein n=1 Tax=Microvirga sp. TaxID=1873136 RepID=UPI001686AE81|nr:ATP-binding cassette domain-containing protein [Microvirga sp.]MBD2750896.1 ATP-binding cassette domain-containing protein [Microvirga sp.]